MKKDRTRNIEDKEKDEDKTYENETNNDMDKFLKEIANNTPHEGQFNEGK
tara:strand:- start:186 stop:335 length:150 start_codon:yes stop_codon:yes gene_type:complete